MANKSYAIPNYQGYIPMKNPESELGKSITTVSRRCFTKDRLDHKTSNIFATTG